MFERHPTPRTLAVIAALVCVSAMTGCVGSNKIGFTNVTDVWLDVRVFVEAPDTEDSSPSRFVSEDSLKVEPGKTVHYSLTRNSKYHAVDHPVVHVKVEPVTPSWEHADHPYWLELLSPPPVDIIASGASSKISFNFSQGSVQMIPEKMMKRKRFEHEVILRTAAHGQ